MLRFDDLAQTVLAAGDRRGAGAVTLWRQCVDLIAQRDRADRGGMDADERAALLERLAGLRDGVTETQRLATVVELGGRLRSASLVEFFAGDRPAVIAAALSRARLPEAAWVAMLPRLSPTARGVLRARRDMGAEVRRALDSFGAADLVLTSDVAVEPEMMLSADMAEAVVAPVAEVAADPAFVPAEQIIVPDTPDFAPIEPGFAPPAPPADQIRHLVDRIEQFTSQRRDASDAHIAPATAGPASVRAFTFESDASGTIIWVGEGPRAALIGLTLAEPALAGGSGPDGHVAGAFARRSGFQNGRFTIVGGMMAGEWRLSATPFFDPRTGRFQGYRGQARRPHLHEVATAPDQSAIFPGLSGDSLRQLVHELRTPLNAILGFAEIIEQELFGPAGVEYREMAGNIAVDARHLLAAFDDLDLAARVARGDGGGEATSVDAALMVAQVAARFAHGDAGRHGVDIAIAADLPPVRIDPVQGERMVQHLLRTLVSVAPIGEPVTGTCWFQPGEGAGRVVMAVDRPSSLDGMEETQLLDPGYTPDGDWPDGPLLGMGFSLRLIRSLAEGCGGALTIDGNRFLLSMPAQGVGDGHFGDTAY